MGDRKKVDTPKAIEQITPELKVALNEAKNKLKSSDRRQFMAQIVESLGPGGQRRAQRELGWNRNTIIKGTKELKSGMSVLITFPPEAVNALRIICRTCSTTSKTLLNPLVRLILLFVRISVTVP
jgi:hypothetical protein